MAPLPCSYALWVLLGVLVAGGCRATLVVVVLDEQQQELLADGANGTNMHSLRALWARGHDFWDIAVDHDCQLPEGASCEFSPDQSRISEADAVLISAQVFPSFGHWERVLASLRPNQTSILWSTEAVSNFRMGPQLSLLRAKVIDNLLVRIHFIIVMIRWTGLAPWGFEFPFPGSLSSTFIGKVRTPPVRRLTHPGSVCTWRAKQTGRISSGKEYYQSTGQGKQKRSLETSTHDRWLMTAFCVYNTPKPSNFFSPLYYSQA